jgi:glycosyltransferase involved in cell wall biosynthesis
MFLTERNNLISVIISIYNYKYPRNLWAVLRSLRNQSIDIEIVLSEQGLSKESPYKHLAKVFNAKYILSKPDLINGKEVYNIGRVRNIGALISSGKYLYFSDADILIYNSNYLQTILEKSVINNKYNWYRPSMYRLSEETCRDFIIDYLYGKNNNAFNQPDICMIDYDKTLFSLKPISEGECNGIILSQPFVCTKEEFDIINSEGFDVEKADKYIWKARFHYGGTFCSFKNFMAVAGYCELYYNYGCEDGDFHYKLKLKSGIEQIDSIVTQKSIIHFEHERKINPITKNNVNIREERSRRGIDEIIKFDINNEKSFIGSYIREDMNTLRNFFADDVKV